MEESQSPQAGQFNSYRPIDCSDMRMGKSQSPQAGQFNSYSMKETGGVYCVYISLNPLKRVNSILTKSQVLGNEAWLQSQSPQAGQFNSYMIIMRCYRHFIKSQSPQAGQFNSYRVKVEDLSLDSEVGLNPLKRVNSILT